MDKERLIHAQKVIETAFAAYLMIFSAFIGMVGFISGLLSITFIFAMVTGEIPSFFYSAWTVFDIFFWVGMTLFAIWFVCWFLLKYVIPEREKKFKEFVDLVAKKVRDRNAKRRKN